MLLVWCLESRGLSLLVYCFDSHALNLMPQVPGLKSQTPSLRLVVSEAERGKPNKQRAISMMQRRLFNEKFFIKMHLPGDRLKGDGTLNAFLPSEHLVWRKFPLEEFTLKHSNRSISFISISLEVFPSEAFPVKKIPFKAFYSKNSPSNEICTSLAVLKKVLFTFK